MDQPPAAPPRSKPATADLIAAVRHQIRRAVVGQDDVIDQLLAGLLAGGHVLLEGLPGLGKTLLVRSLAATFSGRFARIQFTPDLMPADISGHAIYNPKEGKFMVRRGPIFTNLLLADEINRAPAKTQAALLEVMQEYQATLEGRPHKVPAPFMVVATQNPIELEGTYPLPEAQLDRFLLMVTVDYPKLEEEQQLVAQVVASQVGESLDTSAVEAVLDGDQLVALQTKAASLTVDQRIIDYAVAIVRQSRETPGVLTGASPRAAIGLVRIARAAALLAGRDFVIPEDVKRFAPAVLRHRVKLTVEFEIEARSRDQVVADLIDQVPAPRQ